MKLKFNIFKLNEKNEFISLFININKILTRMRSSFRRNIFTVEYNIRKWFNEKYLFVFYFIAILRAMISDVRQGCIQTETESFANRNSCKLKITFLYQIMNDRIVLILRSVSCNLIWSLQTAVFKPFNSFNK